MGFTGSRLFCVCPQASLLGRRVQCYAHHLLRISGASCKVSIVLLAHSPPWVGTHIAGGDGDILGGKTGQSTGTCPWGLGPQTASLWKLGRGHFLTITVTFTLTVPREQRASLQQHAAAQGEDLGWGGDSRHGHSPRCLHGHG